MGKATDEFKNRTKELFRPIEGIHDADDVEGIVREHVDGCLADAGIDDEVSVKGMAVFGSRSRGAEHDGSDIDVVVEFSDTGWSEDSLFDVMNDEDDRLSIEGIVVDINPIITGKSGTLDEFLARTILLYESKGWK